MCEISLIGDRIKKCVIYEALELALEAIEYKDLGFIDELKLALNEHYVDSWKSAILKEKWSDKNV